MHSKSPLGTLRMYSMPFSANEPVNDTSLFLQQHQFTFST